MMLLAFVLAQQDGQMTAGKLVSKMIARYHDAKSIRGECTTSVSMGITKLSIRSTLQIQRPTKLYLRQDVVDHSLTFFLTSDGNEFSYQKPVSGPVTDRFPNARLVEPVTPQTSLGEIYHAASQSLAERSIVLDIAVSDIPDLQMMRDQWKSLSLTGQVDLNGVKAYKIVGDWRLNKVSTVTGSFEIYITEDGDLKKYVVEQLPGAGGNQDGFGSGEKITRESSVDFTVNADTDPKLFTVLR